MIDSNGYLLLTNDAVKKIWMPFSSLADPLFRLHIIWSNAIIHRYDIILDEPQFKFPIIPYVLLITVPIIMYHLLIPRTILLFMLCSHIYE